MLIKQPCQNCGMHIEFDTEQLSEDSCTVACPNCESEVTLHKATENEPTLQKPPIIEETPATTRSSSRSRLTTIASIPFLVGLFVVVLVVSYIVAVAMLRSGSKIPSPASPGIVPLPHAKQKPFNNQLGEYAFQLSLKELNKYFGKFGEYVFVAEYDRKGQVRYTQGKTVTYYCNFDSLSEADSLNGLEMHGQAEFFVTGPRRTYSPAKMQHWGEWTMFPGDRVADNHLYGTCLFLRIEKRKGEEWSFVQDSILNREIRPIPQSTIEELLKISGN